MVCLAVIQIGSRSLFELLHMASATRIKSWQTLDVGLLKHGYLSRTLKDTWLDSPGAKVGVNSHRIVV